MPYTLYDSAVGSSEKPRKATSGIVAGTVINNCDLINQGKVLVRIPSMDQEVWARISAAGAGSGTGFLFVPNPNDEVLVAVSDDGSVDAYIVGGVWSTSQGPPVATGPEAVYKRVFKTGTKVTGDAPMIGGHELEFDDMLQSITIRSSGLTPADKQVITMDPTGIELKNEAGTIRIRMDSLGQSITIEALKSIELKAAAEIKLQAAKIDISGTALTSVSGGIVKIN